MDQNNEPNETDGTPAGSEPPVVPEAQAQESTTGATPDAVVAAEAPAAADLPPADAAASADVAAPASAAPAAPNPLRGRGRLAALIGGVAAIALVAGGGGFVIGASITAASTMTSSSVITEPDTRTPDTRTPNYGETAPFGGFGNSGGSGATSPFGDRGSGSSGTSGTTGSSATAATDAQKVGVVTIVSNLYFSGNSEAAGTGVILSPDGSILTNNHVIDGATSITVTVESTGRTYQAEVVGTDATNDIALLQLEGASGLGVATADTASDVAIGDEVTSVGNAQGTGDLVAAAGTVTALDESITVGNEYTGASESLNGLIQVDADVVSGDSGGPLVDSDGEVIGIVTAASSGSADVTGYAIPITTALGIVEQINSGDESGTVTIGLPAFLGVELSSTQQANGVILGGVIADMPAEAAGLVAGDVITAVDGTAVTTAEGLSAAIAAHEPGDTVTITYTDAAGAAQQATATLVEGPAA